MANIITGSRVRISIALLFCPVFSLEFYTLYLIAGVYDMIDGTIARRINTVSEFGARFDTAADFVFVVVCLIKHIKYRRKHRAEQQCNTDQHPETCYYICHHFSLSLQNESISFSNNR